MIQTILPICLLIWLTINLLNKRDNVILEQLSDISTTSSRWLVIMVVDLPTYDQLFDKLYNSKNDIKKINNWFVKYLYNNVSLEDKYSRVRNRNNRFTYWSRFCLQQFIMLSSNDRVGFKRRRSLLLFVDNAFRFLFWTDFICWIEFSWNWERIIKDLILVYFQQHKCFELIY